VRHRINIETVSWSRNRYNIDLTEMKLFRSLIYVFSRSRWPRGLGHELSSLARTLWSWVRISHRAWMFDVCAFLRVCVVLYLGRGLGTGLIPRPRSPTDCLRIKKLKWNKAFHGCPMLQHRSNRKRYIYIYMSLADLFHSLDLQFGSEIWLGPLQTQLNTRL
jgi:hypothetical protein